MDGDRTLKSNATAEIMRRFNEAFLTRDPSLPPPLVAEDCVIENTVRSER